MTARRAGSGRPRPANRRPLEPPGILRPELFFPAVAAATKEELFAALAAALTAAGVAQHRDALCDALLERERLGSTAIGSGVAVPHARSTVVRQPALAFARSRAGIDFGAPDGAPVRLVFLIVAPYGAPGAAYLPLLAAIARAAADDVVRARLLELETFDELSGILKPALTQRGDGR